MKFIRNLRVEAIDFQEDLNLGYEDDMIKEFLDNFGEYPEDMVMEIADNWVEIFNSKLFDLYSKNLGLMQWYEEASASGLLEGTDNLIQSLQIGQYEYNSYILYQVFYYIEELAEQGDITEY